MLMLSLTTNRPGSGDPRVALRRRIAKLEGDLRGAKTGAQAEAARQELRALGQALATAEGGRVGNGIGVGMRRIAETTAPAPPKRGARWNGDPLGDPAITGEKTRTAPPARRSRVRPNWNGDPRGDPAITGEKTRTAPASVPVRAARPAGKGGGGEPMVSFQGHRFPKRTIDALPFTLDELQRATNENGSPVLRKDGRSMDYNAAFLEVVQRTGLSSIAHTAPATSEEMRAYSAYGTVGVGKTVGFNRGQTDAMVPRGADRKRVERESRIDPATGERKTRSGRIRKDLNDFTDGLAGGLSKGIAAGANYALDHSPPFAIARAVTGKRVVPPAAVEGVSGVVGSLLAGGATSLLHVGAELQTLGDPEETPEHIAGAAANILIGLASDGLGKTAGPLVKKARGRAMAALKGSSWWGRVAGAKTREKALALAKSLGKLEGRQAEAVVEAARGPRPPAARRAQAPTKTPSPKATPVAISGVQGAWEDEVRKLVGPKILKAQEVQDTIQLWRARANAWVREKPGRTVEGFYRQHAPRISTDGPIPVGALLQGDYRHMKKGGDPRFASVEDLLQFDREDGKVPVHFTISDRARAIEYDNKATGAKTPMYGGIESGRTPESYGKVGWYLGPDPAKTRMAEGLQWSNGLVLPFASGEDTVLNSMHGAFVLKAEIDAALRNGTATEKQLLDRVNDVFRQGDLDSVENLQDILPALSRLGFRPRKQFVRRMLGKKQNYLPDYETVYGLMNREDLSRLRNGDILGLLYGDPKHGPIDPASLGLPAHPVYGFGVPGINLGETRPVNLRSLVPEEFERMRIFLANKRGVDPEAISDGEVYSKTLHRFEIQGNNGTISNEQLASLAHDGRGVRDPLADDAPGRVAHDEPSGAGGLREARLRKQDDPSGPLYQRSVHGSPRAVAGGPERGGVRSPGLRRVGGRRGGLDEGVVRGAVTFPKGERPVVHLLTGRSNVSTVLHESAHVWRRTLPASDLSILGRHYGIGDGAWTREAEERFARHVERYLRDGVAPSAELRGVFERFRGWLTTIYGKVRGSEIGEAVHPEIRDVLDRMLGGAGAGG